MVNVFISPRQNGTAVVSSSEVLNTAMDKAWKRPLNSEMLAGTHLPDDQQYACGDFVTAILQARPNAMQIQLQDTRNGVWTATIIDFSSYPYVIDAKGHTPVEALDALVKELHVC